MQARALIGSFGASALIQAVNIATGVVLARSLGATDRGQLAAALLWPALLAAVGALGLSDAATFHSSRRTYPSPVVVGTSLALAGALSVPLVVAGVVVFPAILGDYGDESLRAATLMLAFVPLNLASLSLMGVLAGLQRYSVFNALRFLVIGASGAGVLGLAAVGELTITSAAVSYLVANALTLLVAAVAAGQVVRAVPQVRLTAARALLGFGLRAHLSSVTSQLNERLDQLLISLFLAPALLGIYVVAATLSSVTLLVGTSISLIALPAIANYADDVSRTAAVRRAVSSTLAASALVTVPIVVLAPQLISLFFGQAFAAGATPARILLCAAVSLGTARVLASVLKALDRPLAAGTAELLALATTAAALAVLLPLFGLTGAAVASLLAYATSAAWMLRRVAQTLDVSALSLVLPRRAQLASALGAVR